FAAVGLDGRSECRKIFNSGCLVGFHRRNAAISCAGAPGATQQLSTARNRGLLIGGPWSVLTSLLASCARSTLSKMENEANSETASARAMGELPTRSKNRIDALVKRRRTGSMVSNFM